MRIIIPENIINVMSLLEESGFEAYAVGGCVRDSLLGRKPYDTSRAVYFLKNG